MSNQYSLRSIDCGDVDITEGCGKGNECVKCCIPKCNTHCLKKNGGSLNSSTDCKSNCEEMCDHTGNNLVNDGKSVFDLCKQNPNLVENQCNPDDIRNCCINKCVMTEKGEQQTQNCQNTCNNLGKQYCSGGFMNNECNIDDDCRVGKCIKGMCKIGDDNDDNTEKRIFKYNPPDKWTPSFYIKSLNDMKKETVGIPNKIVTCILNNVVKKYPNPQSMGTELTPNKEFVSYYQQIRKDCSEGKKKDPGSPFKNDKNNKYINLKDKMPLSGKIGIGIGFCVIFGLLIFIMIRIFK